jgi:hypothetical protein
MVAAALALAIAQSAVALPVLSRLERRVPQQARSKFPAHFRRKGGPAMALAAVIIVLALRFGLDEQRGAIMQ